MNAPEDRPIPLTDPLIIKIVNELEEHGIDPDTYTLYDYIDLDTLEQLVTSSNACLDIRLTIEGVQLGITRHGVRVLD